MSCTQPIRSACAASRLLDEVAPWQPVHLHPQPEATRGANPDGAGAFRILRLRDWVTYKDTHGQDAVVDVYKGKADGRACAIFDTYRRVDIEYQHVQQQMRIERLESQARPRGTRLRATFTGTSLAVSRPTDAVTGAMTEHGEEGALWQAARATRGRAPRSSSDSSMACLASRGLRWPRAGLRLCRKTLSSGGSGTPQSMP